MANIFLSMPILGKPCLQSVYSLYQSILSCPKHKVRVYYNLNDSLVSRVRNVHLSAFYNDFPECDYFMSIDSDIEILNCYPSNNIFSKLIEHDLDFVGGLYALKRQNEVKCSSISMSGLTPQFNTGLQEMRWLSSGCWCIKRSAVKKMIDAYPELIYDGDDNASGKKVYGLYIPMIYDLKKEDFPDAKLPYLKYLSEDWAFAARWKAIGGKIWADSSIVLKHIGEYSYSLYNVEMVVKNKEKQDEIPPAGFDLEK